MGEILKFFAQFLCMLEIPYKLKQFIPKYNHTPFGGEAEKFCSNVHGHFFTIPHCQFPAVVSSQQAELPPGISPWRKRPYRRSNFPQGCTVSNCCLATHRRTKGAAPEEVTKQELSCCSSWGGQGHREHENTQGADPATTAHKASRGQSHERSVRDQVQGTT